MRAFDVCAEWAHAHYVNGTRMHGTCATRLQVMAWDLRSRRPAVVFQPHSSSILNVRATSEGIVTQVQRRERTPQPAERPWGCAANDAQKITTLTVRLSVPRLHDPRAKMVCCGCGTFEAAAEGA